MKRSLAGVLAAVALVATVGLTGPAAMAKGSLTASGSSFANNIMQACKTHYSGADLTYASVGSGAGRTAFKSGTTSFGMSDGTYAPGTQPSNFVYVPVVGGPIALDFNVPGVKKINLDGPTIGNIYLGQIKNWNDAAIVKLNKGVKLPNLAIQPIYRGDSSGTSQNFTNYLGMIAGGAWKSVSAFNTIPGVVGTAATGGAGVATAVKNTVGALGYGDLSDAVANGLTYASVLNAAGQYIHPDVRSAAAFLSVQHVANNGIVTFDYKSPVRGGYAVSLVSYALARKDGNADVKGFLKDFVTSCAPTNAAGLSYVAISGSLKAKALDLIDQIG